MKLSKSKLALAKVINENGGWPQDSEWAVQNGDHGRISFSINKPVRFDSKSWMATGGFNFKIEVCKPLKNWHQNVLSREEYHQAYPKADDIKLEIRWVRGGEVCATPTSHDCMVMLKERGDSLQCDCKECNDFYRREETSHEDADVDGWIEWKGGDTPVNHHSLVDVKYLNGTHEFGFEAGGYDWDWGSGGGLTIVAYRLHKPEVNPEFCESVMRSIPEPVAYEKLSQDAAEAAKVALMSESIEESKRRPTIEQLAQDYRNAKDYAVRLQKEAGDAAVKAEEFAVEIRKKILELQELVG